MSITQDCYGYWTSIIGLRQSKDTTIVLILNPDDLKGKQPKWKNDFLTSINTFVRRHIMTCEAWGYLTISKRNEQTYDIISVWCYKGILSNGNDRPYVVAVIIGRMFPMLHPQNLFLASHLWDVTVWHRPHFNIHQAIRF